MEAAIDLHVHSTFSDGTCTPTELVRIAEAKNLRAFALTDHDTVRGIPEAREAAADSSVEVIAGIELSTNYNGRDLHILGLGIDYTSEVFLASLHEFRDSRTVRNRKLIASLTAHGIDISVEKLQAEFPAGVLTRAHMAAYLQNHGYVATKDEAFKRYLGDKAPCFVPREKVTPQMGIDLIHTGGGKAVLAHPLLYGLSRNGLKTHVGMLKEQGIDGIEVVYSKNQNDDTSRLRHLAEQFELPITGGSDFHGENSPGIEMGTGKGNLFVPYSLWEALQHA
ncbi:MAG: PHP domain-containing protein [Lachnospiraceae bacterium]